MDELRRYELEGMTVEIPIRKDEKTGKIIEIYPDFIENPIWTPMGHRILFSGTDACAFAEEATEEGCLDCGSCKHFKRADEHTWFGVCTNETSLKNREKLEGEIK